MKTFQDRSNKIIFLLFFIAIINCKDNQKDKIISIFSSKEGTKWNCYPIDSDHSYYAYRVKEFYSDGNMHEYINNKSTKKIEKIPYSDLWNPEKWFVLNDSTVSVESVYNPKTKYYYKYKRKILFYNKDTIILQGTKESKYQGVLILTKYKKN